MKRVKTHNKRKKFPVTSTVCHYVMFKLGQSGREMAGLLSIHHSTWQGYLAGEHQPNQHKCNKMAELMQVDNFHELIRLAFRYYRKPI